MGDRDTAKARQIIAEAGLEKLSLESVGWLLSVLSGDAASQAEVAAIRRHLNNRATEKGRDRSTQPKGGDLDMLWAVILAVIARLILAHHGAWIL